VIKLDCLTLKDLYIKYTLQVELSWVHLRSVKETKVQLHRQYVPKYAVSVKKVYDECQGLHPCYILVIVFTLFKKFHKIMCFASGLSYLSTLC
jgi:hypothetical protein